MRKIFTIIKIWSVIYWIIYFISAFYKWELYNPFWWVLELESNQEVRYTILMILASTLPIFCFIYSFALDKNGKFTQ